MNKEYTYFLDKIFKVNADNFEQLSIEIFHYQYLHNPIYKQFVDLLKINIHQIKSINQIPFLPIEFFKTERIITKSSDLQGFKNLEGLNTQQLFVSSGTSGIGESKHFVTDISIYEKSYRNSFELFYGNPEEYCFWALLPSYLERGNSSLIYMLNDFINLTKHNGSGFYLYNTDDLIDKIKKLNKSNQKIILLGVTYALLDLADKFPLFERGSRGVLNNLIIMETGGMKGKRKEMIKEELHKILSKKLGVAQIHSEYGMTELLSQAYSKGDGLFYCPPWMKILIRDTNDPFTISSLSGRSGGVNIIDLANINSCCFIATQDLGKTYNDNSFEVLGRFAHSDIRGCNLLVG